MDKKSQNIWFFDKSERVLKVYKVYSIFLYKCERFLKGPGQVGDKPEAPVGNEDCGGAVVRTAVVGGRGKRPLTLRNTLK